MTTTTKPATTKTSPRPARPAHRVQVFDFAANRRIRAALTSLSLDQFTGHRTAASAPYTFEQTPAVEQVAGAVATKALKSACPTCAAAIGQDCTPVDGQPIEADPQAVIVGIHAQRSAPAISSMLKAVNTAIDSAEASARRMGV